MESQIQRNPGAIRINRRLALYLNSSRRCGGALDAQCCRAAVAHKGLERIAARVENRIGRTMPLGVVVPALWSGPGFVAAVVLPCGETAVPQVFFRGKQLPGPIALDVEKGIGAHVVGHDAAANVRNSDQRDQAVFEIGAFPTPKVTLLRSACCHGGSRSPSLGWTCNH